MLRILLEGGKPPASDASGTETPSTTLASGITEFPVGSPQSYRNTVLTRAAEGNKDSRWVEEEFARMAAARNKAPSTSR